jgi:hypothetical protein
MYRVDVLKQGKDARGHTVLPEEDAKKYLGKGVGFSTLTVSSMSTKKNGSFFRTFARAQSALAEPELTHSLNNPPTLTLTYTALRVATDLGGFLPPRLPFGLRERDRRDAVLVL